ncbi:hypothetical protein VRU48_06205 [Pedobacter sp. KR3-3]|uniref:Uncharacterized protein n=1 Tax=Pedobacter albus TaxID=3113905 RepID=A0ABU7I5Q8_9SPHI|nr:hypothetical protein [Pedobacter sp. KR3-3]MEE1944692.1 hypothetical protein [Pedobacter sp. KR3-3]
MISLSYLAHYNQVVPIRAIVVFLGLLFFSCSLYAQDYKDSVNKKLVIPDKWKASLNGSYSTLVGADGNGGTIGSYASLDPLNASLSFKGTLPIAAKSGRMSFLSIAAQGSLVDGNFATVFKNTKLNTSAGINVEYNFRFGKDNPAEFGANDAKYTADMNIITEAESNAVKAYTNEIAKIATRQTALQEQITRTNAQVTAKELQLKALDKTINNATETYENKEKAYVESQKIIAELPKMRKSLETVNFQIDSLGVVSANSRGLIIKYRMQQRTLANEKRAKLQNDYQFAEFKLFWVTLTAGAGKVDYYTFDSTKPFADQLQNPNLPTYKFGFALNFYDQDNLTKKAWMANLGVQWMKDNNLSLLSTQEISQESVYKNTAGDVTRKATKKYTAYTEPDKIADYQQLSVFSNLYHIFNGGNIALHFFPSFYKPKDKRGYLDTGLGMMFSFKDQKKEKSTLNLEAYFVSLDSFNSLDATNKFWDRNEFGVRVTLPFNKLFK